jgi:guanylate kinase
LNKGDEVNSDQPSLQKYSGMLYIISAPSGAGKTSLVKALVESMENVEVSVSYTTRPMRPGERDGVDYHFVDRAIFKQMIEQGAFLEHAQVFDNFYGTSKEKVLERLQAGKDVILEIDWQGARQVRNSFPASYSIFILPPSRTELETRLRARGQDDEQIIARRMRAAINEISHYKEFDYLVINDDFTVALHDLKTIVSVRYLAAAVQTIKRADLISNLLA